MVYYPALPAVLPSQHGIATAARKGLSGAEHLKLPSECEKRAASFLYIPQNVYSEMKKFGLNHCIVN